MEKNKGFSIFWWNFFQKNLNYWVLGTENFRLGLSCHHLTAYLLPFIYSAFLSTKFCSLNFLFPKIWVNIGLVNGSRAYVFAAPCKTIARVKQFFEIGSSAFTPPTHLPDFNYFSGFVYFSIYWKLLIYVTQWGEGRGFH